VLLTSAAQFFEDVLELCAHNGRSDETDFVVQIQDRTWAQVMVDPSRLRQVVLNVVCNALKFTAKGSVCVVVGTDPPTGKEPARLRVTVRDTGIGLHGTGTDHLFERYEQVSPERTRQFGGSGLGLSISRYLCRSMGGDIQLSSDGLNCGSVCSFWVRIEPCVPQPHLRDWLLLAQLPHASLRSVLLYMPSGELQQFLQDCLRHSGVPSQQAVTQDEVGHAVLQQRDSIGCVLFRDRGTNDERHLQKMIDLAREGAARHVAIVPVCVCSRVPIWRRLVHEGVFPGYLVQPVLPRHLARVLSPIVRSF
jgi:hypothetical protein